MRIDCEQCGAAFSIDDKMISDRGVRAQCPKCGHQKVVKKPDSNPLTSPAPVTAMHQAPPLPQAPPPPNPFAAPPGATGPFGAAPAPNPFAPPAGAQNPFAPPAGSADPNATMPRAAAPFGATVPSAPPVSSANPFGAAASSDPFGAPSAPVGSPFAAPPAGSPFGAPSSASPFAPSSAAAPTPFGAGASPSPFGAQAPAAGNPFGSGAAPASPFAAPTSPPAFAAPPSQPPKPVDDPFARLGAAPVRPAMGGTAPAAHAAIAGPAHLHAAPAAPAPVPALSAAPDDPFAKLELGGPGPAAAEAARPQRWQVKTAAGMDADVDFQQLRDLIKAGTVGPDDEAAPVGEPLKKVGAQPLLAVPRPGTAGPRVVSGARARSAPSFGRIAAGVAVVLVVGGGLAVYKLKPELFEGGSDAGVNPLRGVKSTWEMQFPNPPHTAQEHVDAGRAAMRLDTAAGYRKADDELRQALIREVGNVKAIAAWVENFAGLPAMQSDIETGRVAKDAIAWALRKKPDDPDANRAEGALLLAMQKVDDAQRRLMKARDDDPSDMQTLLVLARSHLDRNAAEALSLIGQVRRKAPELKQAIVVEGAAQRRLGAFKYAREVLGERLASDPANTGALKELAKLELDVGNPEQAIEALSRLIAAEERDVDAHLMRAKIAYQILGGQEGLTRAEQYLDLIVEKYDAVAGELLLPVLAHAAFVKGELGKLDDAIKLAERARGSDGAHPPVLFVLGRVYGLKGDTKASREALERAVTSVSSRDSFYEPVVRTELGRAQGADGDTVSAIRSFEQAIEYDPRSERAHFGLASLYVKSDKMSQGMTMMARAMQNDPSLADEKRILTDYPTARRDFLAMADVFKAAKAPAADSSLAAQKEATEGVLRFHGGQKKEAEVLLRRALAEDQFSHAALLYLGVIELSDSRLSDARKHLHLAATTTGKGHLVTQMYLARAELLTGDPESARKRLQDVIDQDATLVQASYSLGMLLRQQNLEGQALEELRKVIKADPDYTPAKRALANAR
ncbi:MAG: zinc-ribbon domain-containing protein [Deltaproteobacteria bacterium]|nr:zinc-ribbon domain-containing protein [Deltaproteobacteria bacterium]